MPTLLRPVPPTVGQAEKASPPGDIKLVPVTVKQPAPVKKVAPKPTPPVVRGKVNQATFAWRTIRTEDIPYQEIYSNSGRNPVGYVTKFAGQSVYHCFYSDGYWKLGVTRGTFLNARTWVTQMVAKHYVATAII